MAKRSALMQKRTKGPSANATLIAHLRTEKCCGKMEDENEKCPNPVVLVKNQNGTTERLCIEHIHSKNVKIKTRPEISREMWWLK